MTLRVIVNFQKDETGAVAVEHGLLAGLIAMMVVTAVDVIGDTLLNFLMDVVNAL